MVTGASVPDAPANVPVNVPEPRRCTISSESSTAGAYPTVPASVGPPIRLIDPPVATWLNCPAPVPFRVTRKVDPALRVAPPTVRMPVGLPGASVPPLLTVTAPEMVPVPDRVPPVTVTGPVPVADPLTLVTVSVPWATVVPPV